MEKIYYFDMINNGTEKAPAWTFAEIALANNSKVEYLLPILTVRVTKEVTAEQDEDLVKTDLSSVVYDERVASFKATADAVRAAKISPV